MYFTRMVSNLLSSKSRNLSKSSSKSNEISPSAQKDKDPEAGAAAAEPEEESTDKAKKDLAKSAAKLQKAAKKLLAKQKAEEKRNLKSESKEKSGFMGLTKKRKSLKKRAIPLSLISLETLTMPSTSSPPHGDEEPCTSAASTSAASSPAWRTDTLYSDIVSGAGQVSARKGKDAELVVPVVEKEEEVKEPADLNLSDTDHQLFPSISETRKLSPSKHLTPLVAGSPRPENLQKIISSLVSSSLTLVDIIKEDYHHKELDSDKEADKAKAKDSPVKKVENVIPQPMANGKEKKPIVLKDKPVLQIEDKTKGGVGEVEKISTKEEKKLEKQPVEKKNDKSVEKKPEKQAEKKLEKSPDKKLEKSPDKKQEKPAEKKQEKVADKKQEKAVDKKQDKKQEKSPEKRDKSVEIKPNDKKLDKLTDKKTEKAADNSKQDHKLANKQDKPVIEVDNKQDEAVEQQPEKTADIKLQDKKVDKSVEKKPAKGLEKNREKSPDKKQNKTVEKSKDKSLENPADKWLDHCTDETSDADKQQNHEDLEGINQGQDNKPDDVIDESNGVKFANEVEDSSQSPDVAAEEATGSMDNSQGMDGKNQTLDNNVLDNNEDVENWQEYVETGEGLKISGCGGDDKDNKDKGEDSGKGADTEKTQAMEEIEAAEVKRIDSISSALNEAIKSLYDRATAKSEDHSLRKGCADQDHETNIDLQEHEKVVHYKELIFEANDEHYCKSSSSSSNSRLNIALLDQDDYVAPRPSSELLATPIDTEVENTISANCPHNEPDLTEETAYEVDLLKECFRDLDIWNSAEDVDIDLCERLETPPPALHNEGKLQYEYADSEASFDFINNGFLNDQQQLLHQQQHYELNQPINFMNMNSSFLNNFFKAENDHYELTEETRKAFEGYREPATLTPSSHHLGSRDEASDEDLQADIEVIERDNDNDDQDDNDDDIDEDNEAYNAYNGDVDDDDDYDFEKIVRLSREIASQCQNPASNSRPQSAGSSAEPVSSFAEYPFKSNSNRSAPSCTLGYTRSGTGLNLQSKASRLSLQSTNPSQSMASLRFIPQFASHGLSRSQPHSLSQSKSSLFSQSQQASASSQSSIPNELLYNAEAEELQFKSGTPQPRFYSQSTFLSEVKNYLQSPNRSQMQSPTQQLEKMENETPNYRNEPFNNCPPAIRSQCTKYLQCSQPPNSQHTPPYKSTPSQTHSPSSSYSNAYFPPKTNKQSTQNQSQASQNDNYSQLIASLQTSKPQCYISQLPPHLHIPCRSRMLPPTFTTSSPNSKVTAQTPNSNYPETTPTPPTHSPVQTAKPLRSAMEVFDNRFLFPEVTELTFEDIKANNEKAKAEKGSSKNGGSSSGNNLPPLYDLTQSIPKSPCTSALLSSLSILQWAKVEFNAAEQSLEIAPPNVSSSAIAQPDIKAMFPHTQAHLETGSSHLNNHCSTNNSSSVTSSLLSIPNFNFTPLNEFADLPSSVFVDDRFRLYDRLAWMGFRLGMGDRKW